MPERPPEKLSPKKQLGQHFLHERGVVQRIVDLVKPRGDESLLEIGPGEGALTDGLLALGRPLTLVELDPRAAALLRQRYAQPPVQVLEQSILDVCLPPGPWVVAGNLPYNISSPIFFWLLQHRAQVRQAVVMVQLEVAQRICAQPGSRAWGLLGVLLGQYWQPRLALRVAPGAFRPPPNVQSAVVELLRDPPADREPSANEPPEFDALLTVAKAAFGQRRKTLGNALKALGMPVPEGLANLRAEQLSRAQFADLALRWQHHQAQTPSTAALP